MATLAHVAQQKYDIAGAKAVYVSSACSSFVNGLEIIEGYFAMGKATKALLICSEHNTYYRNESDPKCGHLWGDAAVAYFISKERVADSDMTIRGVYTCGLGNVGKGPEGVHLRPHEDGITMPFGKDVFVRACQYMIEALDNVVKPQGLKINDLDYIICHQANKRIVNNVAHQLEFARRAFPPQYRGIGQHRVGKRGIGACTACGRVSQGYDFRLDRVWRRILMWSVHGGKITAIILNILNYEIT